MNAQEHAERICVLCGKELNDEELEEGTGIGDQTRPCLPGRIHIVRCAEDVVGPDGTIRYCIKEPGHDAAHDAGVEKMKDAPQHAPGPWRANGTDVLDADGFCIVEIAETAILPDWDSLGIEHWARAPGVAFIEVPTEEAEARAHLIAAAPGLLKAARKVATVLAAEMQYYGTTEWEEELERAGSELRAAIQKAEGK